MIDSSLTLNIAETILLNLGNSTAECVVRWVKGQRIGLEFTADVRVGRSREELRRARDIIKPLYDHSPRSASARKASSDGQSGPHRFFSQSGEPIKGSHRWVARLRNVTTPGLVAECSCHFRLASEIVLDLGSSGMISAKIGWSPFGLGGRARCGSRT